MKKINLFGKYLMALIFAALIFHTGCKREEGYYSTSDLNNETALDTYAYLKSKTGVYDSLLLLIDKLGMEETLRDSNITLFAPSNTSFQIAIKNLNDVRRAQGKSAVSLKDIAAGRIATPSAKERPKAIADSANLDTMLARYIVKKQFLAGDFSVGDGQVIYSVRGDYPMHGQRIYADAQGWQEGGSEIIEFANTKRSIFVANWSKTTTTSVNIKTKNGVVHLLRQDHVFGFDEFVRRLTLVPPPTNLFINPGGGKWSVNFENPANFDGELNPGEKFIKCLDGNVLTKFLLKFNATNGKLTLNWVPAEPIVSNAYSLTSANDSKKFQDRDPRAWKVEGSLDSLTWVKLDSRQDQVFETNYQQKVYDFINEVPYAYYRLVFLQNNGSSTVQISEWTMNFREKIN